jgi:PIN domain nuclease of toxin-antitoxin system
MESLAVKYLLDTHAAIWAAEADPQIGPLARRALLSAKHGDVFISDITLLEISMLAKKGRIQIAVSLPAYLTRLQSIYPPIRISPTIAMRAMDLVLPQGDPFDRIIVATSLENHLTLVTRDQNITASKLAPTLW